MKIKAVVTRENKTFSLKDINLSEPKDNEVLVKIIASGVCHTDATVIDKTIPVPYPVVLGHEGSGIVTKVGKGVTTVKEGDHVVLGFSYCGHCENCLEGKAGACEIMMQLNFSGVNEKGESPLSDEDGSQISQFFGQSSFSNYTTVNEKNVVKVPEDVDLKYLGPLGCGIMTGSGSVFNSLKPRVGSSIVIFGTGAVGLSALMAAKVSGCFPIIAVDIHDHRLELAKEFGATHTINSTSGNVVEKIKEITEGKGSHFSFETTGINTVSKQAIDCLRVYGTMGTVAVGKKNIELNLTNDIVTRCITIKGIVEGDATPQKQIPILVNLFKSGQFALDKMVGFYKPEEIEKAFEDSAKGKTIKPIIIFE